MLLLKKANKHFNIGEKVLVPTELMATTRYGESTYNQSYYKGVVLYNVGKLCCVRILANGDKNAYTECFDPNKLKRDKGKILVSYGKI
jgi:hypothetical protein